MRIIPVKSAAAHLQQQPVVCLGPTLPTCQPRLECHLQYVGLRLPDMVAAAWEVLADICCDESVRACWAAQHWQLQGCWFSRWRDWRGTGSNMRLLLFDAAARQLQLLQQ